MKSVSIADGPWIEFAKTALRIATTLGLYGWDREVAKEYTRLVEGRCPADRAIVELRRIASSENRLGAASEIVALSRQKAQPDRWIIFEREVIGYGRLSFSRKAPNDDSPASAHLRAGEDLILDTADRSHTVSVEKPEAVKAFKEALGFDPQNPMRGVQARKGPGWYSAGEILKAATLVSDVKLNPEAYGVSEGGR